MRKSLVPPQVPLSFQNRRRIKKLIRTWSSLWRIKSLILDLKMQRWLVNHCQKKCFNKYHQRILHVWVTQIFENEILSLQMLLTPPWTFKTLLIKIHVNKLSLRNIRKILKLNVMKNSLKPVRVVKNERKIYSIRIINLDQTMIKSFQTLSFSSLWKKMK